MGEHRFRFRFIDVKAALDDLVVRVVEAVVFQGTLLQPGKQCFAARTGEMKHFFHVDHFLHDFGLADIPRDPIKDERIDVWLKLVRLDGCIDCRSPKLNGDLIGHKLAFAGVFEEGFAYFRAGVDGAKHIAAGAVIIAWDCAQRFALRPFAATRRAKEDKGIVSHDRNRFIPQASQSRKAESLG